MLTLDFHHPLTIAGFLSGIISQEDLPYIFDRFYQGKNANGAKGTGLGLTIAKGGVEAHGGRIWVESEGLEKGTSLFFTLPVH